MIHILQQARPTGISRATCRPQPNFMLPAEALEMRRKGLLTLPMVNPTKKAREVSPFSWETVKDILPYEVIESYILFRVC